MNGLLRRPLRSNLFFSLETADFTVISQRAGLARNMLNFGMEETMSSDKKGVKVLARMFFTQLQSAGYSSNQILEASSELIELVTNNLKPVIPAEAGAQEVDETARIAV